MGSYCSGEEGKRWWEDLQTLSDWGDPWTKHMITGRQYNGTTEFQSGAEDLGSLGDIWEDAKKLRGVPQSRGNVLQVSGKGGALIWIGDFFYRRQWREWWRGLTSDFRYISLEIGICVIHLGRGLPQMRRKYRKHQKHSRLHLILV